MGLLKLETVDAFVVRDLDDDVPALGIVRSAPKILQSGARELARGQTYQCAAFNIRCQGASAGVNAGPEDRASAIEAFTAELLPLAESGALLLDPAKGVTKADLVPMTAVDPRSEALDRIINGLSNRDHLVGLGAVASAQAARGLDGATVAIDNFDSCGPSVAAAAAERGAKITTVATTSGAAHDPSGFDPAALAEAIGEHGPAMVEAIGGTVDAPATVLTAEVDVLFAGSKIGMLSHTNASSITATTVVPVGPLPYTTKGALMLEAQGSRVLPDFVTTAGAMFASMPPGDDDQAALEATVVDLLGTVTQELLAGDDMPIIEACLRAESYLRTWRDELPFGRPFAP